MVLIHNILAEILLISLNAYMLATHTQNLITCSIRQMFTGLQSYLTVYCIAVMSFLRYHIARKISNQESTQNVFGCMIGVTIWYGLFELFNSAPLPFLLTIFFEIPFKPINLFSHFSRILGRAVWLRKSCFAAKSLAASNEATRRPF